MTTGLINVGFGANTRLAYLIQTAAGAIDESPAWNVLPFSSSEPSVQAEQMEDDSMTGDRNMLEPRSGTVNGQIQASGKLRPGALDALLEACTQGTWEPKFTETGLTVTVVALGGTDGYTVQLVGAEDPTWEDLGIEVGEEVTLAGFEDDGNNDTFMVTEVSGDTITLGDAVDMVATASESDITASTPDNYLKVGNTRRAIAWEIYHSDTDEYIRIIDTEISELSISLSSNGDVNYTLTAIGGEELDLGANIDDPVGGATYVQNMKPFYDSFNGVIEIAGQPAIFFSELNPSMNNNSTPLFAVGNRYPIAVGHQKMNAEMTMTAYYQAETVKALYQAETPVNLKMEMKYSGAEGTDYHVFMYPSSKIISFGRPIPGAGELMENVTIRPFKDASIESSILIRRYIA